MIRSVYWRAAAAALLAAQASAVLGAQSDPKTTVLTPSSDWNMEYADDKCRLARLFGAGDDKVVFYIERFEPSDDFFFVAAGKPLSGRTDGRNAVRFGPGGFEIPHPLQTGDLGEIKPALMSSGIRLVPNKVQKPSETRKTRQSKAAGSPESSMIMEPPVTPAEEERINWLEIEPRGGKVVRLMLGSMGKPMAAMRACTDELMTHWGIDVAAHRGLTRPVAPASDPGSWIDPDDYPTELLRQGAQGLVYFRLSVAQDGKPTQCHIQTSTRPVGFDNAVCAILMKRARFDPALDRTGQPIASYWRSSVRFQIPD